MRISDWSSDVCSSDLDLVGWVERSETHHPAPLGCGLDDGFRFALPILRCCPTELQVGATPPTASIRRCGTTCLRRRSEERHVGKVCVSTFRSRWSPDH